MARKAFMRPSSRAPVYEAPLMPADLRDRLVELRADALAEGWGFGGPIVRPPIQKTPPKSALASPVFLRFSEGRLAYAVNISFRDATNRPISGRSSPHVP